METYVASKVIIIHPAKDRILLVKRRLDDATGYEPAGGRVEIDFENSIAENLEECLVRETYEELGIEIEDVKYQGSYYFFWTIKQHACSICAVFTASTKDINLVKRHTLEGCGNIYPMWVEIDDILNKRILIEKQHVGLLKLLTDIAVDLRNSTKANKSESEVV